MRSSKPPSLATWLIEHLNPGGRNEALTGDLLEQLSQGRSVAWYWRQVFVAIFIGFVKEWRILVLAAAVTGGWAFPLYYGRLWYAPLTEPIFHIGTRTLSLASLIYSTAAYTSLAIGPICFGYAVYFSMTLTDSTTKRSPRKFLLGLLKGYLAVALTTFLLLVFLPARRHPEFVGNVIGLLPVFFGMLVALRTLRPYGSGKGTAKFFRIVPPSSW